MNRRPLIVALLTLLPALAGAEPAEWRFEVLLNDKPIGYHRFTLQSEGAEQVLETVASFHVKFLFITAFRYRHENVETWQNGCLTSLDARTDRNGKRLAVRGLLDDDAFSVTHSRGRETLDECVQSFAYWNPSILAADRLLNTQTGKYEAVEVVREDSDSVTLGGKTIDAERYRLSAEGGDITLWYARDDHRWLKLEAPVKGGRRIRYQPLDVPEAGSYAEAVAGTYP